MAERNLHEQAAEAAAEYRGKRDRRGFKAGGGGITPAERQAERDGVVIGAMVRQRQAAAEAIEQAESIAAALGVAVDESARWGEADDDYPERPSIADAREILAEGRRRGRASRDATRARQAARGKVNPMAGRATIHGARNAERMTDRELLAIGTAAASATAKAINKRAPRRARLTAEEYGDLRGAILLYLAEKGAPRWRAILSDAEAEDWARTLSGTDLATLRGRWIATAILHARGWRAERAERQAAERTAEAAEAEAARLAEGRRILGAEADDSAALKAAEAARDGRMAAAEVADAVADVDAVAELLAADGRPLGKAERLALEAELLGLSRRELAERLGHDPNYVKTATHRGRAAIAARWPEGRPGAAMMRRQIGRAREAAIGAELSAPRARAADVCRWLAEAESMAAAMLADGYSAAMADDHPPAIMRPRPPRRGRRILPMRPTPPVAAAPRRRAESGRELVAWLTAAERQAAAWRTGPRWLALATAATAADMAEAVADGTPRPLAERAAPGWQAAAERRRKRAAAAAHRRRMARLDASLKAARRWRETD